MQTATSDVNLNEALAVAAKMSDHQWRYFPNDLNADEVRIKGFHDYGGPCGGNLHLEFFGRRSSDHYIPDSLKVTLIQNGKSEKTFEGEEARHFFGEVMKGRILVSDNDVGKYREKERDPALDVVAPLTSEEWASSLIHDIREGRHNPTFPILD